MATMLTKVVAEGPHPQAPSADLRVMSTFNAKPNMEIAEDACTVFVTINTQFSRRSIHPAQDKNILLW